MLLSHTLSSAVPSPCPGLASRFGMEAGRLPGAMTTAKSYSTIRSNPFVLQVDCKKTGQWTRLRYRFNFLDSGDRSFPCYLNVLQTDRKECITLQRLVRVSSTPHRASTSRLSSTSSLCRFPNILSSRNPHLGERFPLRCFQRLSYPDLANRQRPWQDDRHTRDPSTPVLSY